MNRLPRLPRLPLPPGPRLTIAAAFFLRGFVQGNWFPRIPGVVSHIDVSQSTLGTVWFLLALSSTIAFSIASFTISRFGVRRAIQFFGLPLPFVFVVAGLASTVPVLTLSMIAFGVTNGVYDIAGTTQANLVEQSTRRPIVAACYGYFSLGALVGSLFGAVAAQEQFPIWIQFALVAAVHIPLLWYLTAHIPGEVPRPMPGAPVARTRRRFSLPPKVLIPYGICVICISLGEESVNNWVALYLRRDLLASAGIASLAYTLFSIATFAGRLTGDSIIKRLGVDRVLAGGSIMASVGILGAVVINQPVAFLVGYVLVGAGMSLVVPVSYRRASEVPGIAPAQAIASVATIGYLGFLAGPMFIGTVADLISLRFALTTVGVLVLGILVMVIRHPGEPNDLVTVQEHAPPGPR